VNALRQIDPVPSLFDYYLVWHTIVLSIITMLAYAVAAGAIFWHRSDDWMAVLISTALLMTGAAASPTLEILGRQPAWFWPVAVVQGLGLVLVLFVFYLFPDGRFVPRWSRSLALLWIGWLVAWAVMPSLTVEKGDLPLALRYLSFLVSSLTHTLDAVRYYLRISSLLLVMLGWFGSGVFAQIYRFEYVSTPIQRQQTKWVVFGLILGVVGYFAYRGPLLLFPGLAHRGTPRTLFILIGEPISILLMLLPPLSMGLSMLRRRLWVIDPIIQSTLVYGTLTGGLALIYLGGVFLFQLLFRTDVQEDAADFGLLLYVSAVEQVEAIQAAPGGGVVYQMSEEPAERTDFAWGAGQWLLTRVRDLITLLVIGALVVWRMPAVLRRTADTARARPLASAGRGVVLLVGGWLGALALAVLIVVVGIMLGVITLGQLSLATLGVGFSGLTLALFLFWLLGAYGSKLVVSYLVGDWLFRRILPRYADRHVWVLGVGILFYMGARSIPVLGWLVGLAATLVGLGAGWLLYRETRQGAVELAQPG